VHLGEIELAFSNAMHQFEAGDRNDRIPKAFARDEILNRRKAGTD
jgi:HAMP domain-containing protein